MGPLTLGHLTRRALLATAPAAPSVARAERRGDLFLGKDNFLFGAWEDVRRVDLGKVRRVAELAAAAAGQLRRAGIEVVLTLAPTRARIYAETLPADFQPVPDADKRYEVALEALRRADALVPDFAAPLLARRRAAPAELLFFRTDSHWTPAGCEPLAAALATEIQARYRLPPAAKPGTRLGPPQARTHPGDLLALLPAADRGRYPPQEPFRPRQVLSAPTGDIWSGLVEEEEADVSIIGNSYMLPYFGFPPMLSNGLARPLNLIWRTARIGPWKTLLDFLGSEGFRRQRPRLVLWHFMEGSMEYGPDAGSWWAENAMPVAAFQTELRRRLND